jgi:hypothetical protein
VENKAKRGIALVALNNVLGETKPSLVADIAETIYISDTSLTPFERNKIVEILKKADYVRGVSYERTYENRSIRISSASEVLPLADSIKTNKEVTMLAQLPTTKDTSGITGKISAILSNIIYIQAANQEIKDSLVLFRKYLITQGYNVPEIEIVPEKFTSSIRIAHEEDTLKAKQLEQVLKNYIYVDASILNFSTIKQNTKAKIPPVGQIEIWVGHNK